MFRIQKNFTILLVRYDTAAVVLRGWRDDKIERLYQSYEANLGSFGTYSEKLNDEWKSTHTFTV